MTAVALNNLWLYLKGMTLPRSDREWLAGKLLEPAATDTETARQQAYVHETLYRALDEAAGGQQLQSAEDFIAEMQAEGI